MTYRIHSTPGSVETSEGQRPCARGDRCLQSTAVRGDDGSWQRQPALGYRTFCEMDRAFLLSCIEQIPSYYAQLADRIGDKTPGKGPKVSGSRATPFPINLTVDELQNEIVIVVASWTGRVDLVADLHRVDTDRPLRANALEPLTLMCETLAAHIDVLLALGPEPMTRFVTLTEAAEYAAAGVPGHVHPSAGYAEVAPDLSGAEAGLELAKLTARCRWLLGLTSKDEKVGGRCLNPACELLDVLVRPDGAAGLADFVECSACGAQYTGEQYKLLMRDVLEQAVTQQKEAS